MNVLYRIIASLTVILLLSCSNQPSDIKEAGTEAPIYPDYADVTIPPGIAPLNFCVTAPGEVTRVDVKVTGSKGGEIHTNGRFANFDIDDWHQLTEENAGGCLTVSVCAKIDGQWIKYSDFMIHVASELIDAWGLTYRRIAPGYEVYSDMGIYQRDLANFNEYPIIENRQTSGQCYNCHTANRTNPDLSVMHVRGDHGATMVQCQGQREWLKAVNDSLGGAMVYPYWHPSGRYCAFSTNQTRQGFHIAGDKRLEVFDFSSDILVYDIEKHEILLDSLTSKPDWSENTPVFSPDGRSIYFTTCLQKSYPLEYKDEQYNLCRIDFDPETGRFGERVDTVFDAVALGKSVTWPRPAYDGRHLVFTLLDYGYFSIWHKESDQWILDLTTREARPIDEINSDDADSYHNFTPDSQWMVFTSRRDDGLYSRLYLTSMDSLGNFTKPFLLPQNDPLTYYRESLYSFNTPDFTSRKVDFDSQAAADEILSDKRIPTKIRTIPNS